MINDFHKEYNFLSNFFDSPIFEEGIFYPTVEHYFQAMKTLNPVERKGIAHAATPSIAKQLGRQVTLRKDWEQVKDQVMEHALHIKFANPDLKNKLLATEPEYLEEGNWWHDNYWGVCYCSKCQNRGKNHLGHILMALRKELKEMDK